MENTNNNGVKIIIAILAIAVVGLSGYLIYDKVIKKDAKENTTAVTEGDNKQNNVINNQADENVTMNVEDKNNNLYVNGNLVTFNDNNNGMQYYILKDVVYVRRFVVEDEDPGKAYFVDRNGKIIKTVGGTDCDIQLSNNGVYFASVSNTDVNNHFIEGNVLYLNIVTDYAAIISPDIAYCRAKDRNALNDIVKYTDKITYLGNGQFKLEKAVETTTFEQIGKEYFQTTFGTEPQCNFGY